ncbi:MAG: RDD family protein [Chitinophagales bacterium]
MEQESDPQQEDLFKDYTHYKTAATGQRFVNWLVDNLVMRFALSYVTGTFVGIMIGKFFPDYADRISYSQDTWDLLLLGYAVGIFNYLLYYTICEKAFKGYTLGKLISGTRAIRDDGKELTFKDALLRSLSRLVPLEAFSGFSKPWHDSWTNTQVIQVR